MAARIPRRPRWPLSSDQRAQLASVLADTGPRPSDLRLRADTGSTTVGFARHVEWIAFRLEAGSSLSRAVASLDVTFTEHDVAMLRAGETSGRPAQVVAFWAALLGSRARRVSLLRSIAFLPLLTLVATVFFLAWAEPARELLMSRSTFELVREGGGWPHPNASKAVALQEFLAAALNPALLIAALLLLVLLAAMIFPERLPRIRHIADRVTLSLPSWGSIVIAEARWILVELLAASVGSGVSLHDAVSSASKAVRSALLREELAAAARVLEEGGTFADVHAGRVVDARLRASLVQALRRPDAPSALRGLARRGQLATDRRGRRFESFAPGAATLAVGVLVGIVATGFFDLMFDLVWTVP